MGIAETEGVMSLSRYSNVTPERKEKERRLALVREKRVRLARHSFWEFCKLESPDFYHERNWHLKLMCWVLQALYEKRLTRDEYFKAANEIAPLWYVASVDWDRMKGDYVYTKLMINIPPRTGKSRTLVNFCKWALGKSNKNKIITGSYNDEMAQDFSRYTRDGIQQEKTYPHQVAYGDVFPETNIKKGDASYGKWALEGAFFSYKGAGVGGSVTGKGCNISIVDDPVKDAEEAFNDNRLEVIWRWYSGTFKSRREKGSIEIVNMTRWAEKDICGRILKGSRGHEWFMLRMEAMDTVSKEMLCPELFDREMYDEYKDTIDESIFDANYHQRPVDKKGRLYKDFTTYEDIPRDEDGNPLFEKIISYTDTADTGGDHLTSLVAGVYQGLAYVLDVLHTREPMEVTEPATAEMLFNHSVGTAKIESNSGGRGFARNVERELWQKYKTKGISVKWFHQSKNKKARILTNATRVMKCVVFPKDWGTRWPDYYRAMNDYKAEGTNAHDDAPDATTGLAEMLDRTENKKKAKAVTSIM